MMHSDKKAGALLREVSDSLGLFAPPTRGFFRDVLNECLSRLYTDLLRETTAVSLSVQDGIVPLASLLSPTGVAVREEDVLSVYVDGDSARYLTPADFAVGAGLASPYYTIEAEQIRINRASGAGRILFLLRPAPCTEENEEAYDIPLSAEFLPLLFARLCGEGYKAANEDALAAKWLNEYNSRLSDFAAYLGAARAAKEGR